MAKTLAASLLALLGLLACSSPGTPGTGAANVSDQDYEYGRHAGQSMRTSPDGM